MKLKRRSLAAPVPEVGARPSTPPEHDEPAHFQSTPGSVVRPVTSAGGPVDLLVHPIGNRAATSEIVEPGAGQG